MRLISGYPAKSLRKILRMSCEAGKIASIYTPFLIVRKYYLVLTDDLNPEVSDTTGDDSSNKAWTIINPAFFKGAIYNLLVVSLAKEFFAHCDNTTSLLSSSRMPLLILYLFVCVRFSKKAFSL